VEYGRPSASLLRYGVRVTGADMRSVVDKLALGHVPFRLLWFLLSVSFCQCSLFIHTSPGDVRWAHRMQQYDVNSLTSTQENNVQRNIEARSCYQCCCGKAISITYSEFVFVALRIQHAMRVRRIVICGLPRSTVFFHITS